jgi:hypothetical protein
MSLTVRPCISGYLLLYRKYEKEGLNSMVMRSSEAASWPATQEFNNILWNPKVRYHVDKSPLIVPILSQINPVNTTPSYLSKKKEKPEEFIFTSEIKQKLSYGQHYTLRYWLRDVAKQVKGIRKG